MRIETVDILCCPFDKKELTLDIIKKDENEDVLSGLLSCHSCRRVFPIVYGIPILAPDEYRDFKLEKPLMDQFKKQLDSKTKQRLNLESGQ
ncbi:MAG: hypothetical protein GVY19_04510 [Bacteroidetes bacterium]|jgi:uncharacterized protein YbaR (Trm112 family)|nr:hypothetical protein [Bacteroidota bacterium]